MVQTAILHIGMHKTGSTSIQTSLAGYDDGRLFTARLSDPNHSIPVYTAFARGYRTYHIWTGRGLTPAEIDAHRDTARQDIEAELSRQDRETVLISGEDIGMIDPEGQAALLDCLRRHVRDVRVICYLRDPLGYACSSFQQRVKAGLSRLPAKSPPAYRKRLTVFLETLGRDALEVEAYDPARFAGDSVVHDFATRIGVDPGVIRERRANVRLSLPATRLLFHFNRTSPLSTGEPALLRARQDLVTAVSRAYRGAEPLDPARFAPLADEADLGWLSEQFGIDMPRPDPAPPLGPYVDTLDRIDAGPLLGALKEAGVETPIRDPALMLHRLYYHFVARATGALPPSQDDPARLGPEDGLLLRDVALKHDSGAPVGRQEAIGLMQMAERARPDGPVIRAALARWQDPATDPPRTVTRPEDVPSEAGSSA